MSDVKLDIEFERPSARFRPGEPIRGFVRARSEEPFECRHLGLTWTRVVESRRPQDLRYGRLDTSGRSKSGYRPYAELPDRRTMGSLEFDGDDRTPRTEYRIAFEFAAPAGPLSYDGEAIRTKWWLSTTGGRLPWSHAATPFELVPWMPGDVPEHDAGYRVAPPTPPDGYDFGSPRYVRRYQAASPGLSLLSRIRNAWARVKAGSVRVECPSTIAAGERLTVRVHFPRGPRARIGEVEVRLAAAESLDARRARPLVLAPHGIVTSHTAALQIADAQPEPGFVDGGTDVWSAALDMPLDAPPSLHTAMASLCWHVEVRCRSKSAPERLLVKPLLVRPPHVGPTPASQAAGDAVSATCH